MRRQKVDTLAVDRSQVQRRSGEQSRLSGLFGGRARRGQGIKVLWITPNFFPRVGGLELYVEKLVGSLSKLCDVGLVTKSGQWFPGDAPLSHFTVTETQPGSIAAHWRVAEELANIVSCFGPDVVHLGGAEVAIHRWAIPESIPVVATVHGNDLTLARWNAPVPNHAERVVEGLNGCAHVFAVSQHTAALCRQRGLITPIRIVTAGCDLEFFRPLPVLGRQARVDLEIPGNLPTILTVSRLVPRKGHLCVLEAIRRLPFHVLWLVAGDGPCGRGLTEAAVNWGLEDRVRLLGSVCDDDLLALYNACDLFVLTPEELRFEDGRIDSEGFGLVFHEASACGKPVIGTRVSGCRDAIIDGGTGMLVPPSDPVQLSSVIEFLLRNLGVANELGLGGSMLVHYSGGWDRLARQTLETYREILQHRADLVEPPGLRIPV